MMATGKIKQLVRNHGFGFITADDGREVFFQHSGGGNGSPLMSNRVRKGRALCMCSLLMRCHRANGETPISSAVAGLKGPSQTDWSD
jgi:hypothetical protein